MNNLKNTNITNGKADKIYRQFFNDSLAGSFISTPSGKLIDCNKAFLNILGFKTKTEALERNSKELYPVKKNRVEKIEKIKKYKKLVNYEEEILKVTGASIYVISNIHGEFDEDKLVLLKGTILDITDRKKVERELIQTANIFNNIQVGLYVYKLEDPKDKEGKTLRLISANQAATDFTGLASEDVVGNTIDDNFPGLREKGIPQIYAKTARIQEATILDDVYYGDHRVIEGAFSVKAFPLPDFCVGVAFDNVTEKRKAEQELKDHKDHLEKLVEERTRELQKKNKLLDENLKVFVGREQTIIKQADRIKKLEQELASKTN